MEDMVVEAKVLPIQKEIDWRYIKDNFGEHLPHYVTLRYVDYRDNLDDDIADVTDAVEKNDLLDLENKCLDEWYLDQQWENENEYWREFKEKVLNELDDYENSLDQFICEEQENIERIREFFDDDSFEGGFESFREWLWDNDKSGDTLRDLISNTNDFGMFYDLNESFGETWGWDNHEYGEAIKLICDKLSLDYKDKKVRDDLFELLANASGGGNLRIYFNASLWDMISGDKNECKYGRSEDDNTDFKSIIFKGNFYVTIYHAYEGSGHWVKMKLDCSLQFNRMNLRVSESEHYCLEKCFGTYSNYGSDDVVFSFQDPTISVEANGELKAEAEKQAEYNRVYKAGGCTFGDMDIRRHRDVYYLNEFPCGSHCPHCGTFWID